MFEEEGQAIRLFSTSIHTPGGGCVVNAAYKRSGRNATFYEVLYGNPGFVRDSKGLTQIAVSGATPRVIRVIRVTSQHLILLKNPVFLSARREAQNSPEILFVKDGARIDLFAREDILNGVFAS